MWYVVNLGESILSVEFAEGDPLGTVVAGPFDTEWEATAAYVGILADEATNSEIIYG